MVLKCYFQQPPHYTADVNFLSAANHDLMSSASPFTGFSQA